MQIIGGFGIELSARNAPDQKPPSPVNGNSFADYLRSIQTVSTAPTEETNDSEYRQEKRPFHDKSILRNTNKDTDKVSKERLPSAGKSIDGTAGDQTKHSEPSLDAGTSVEPGTEEDTPPFDGTDSDSVDGFALGDGESRLIGPGITLNPSGDLALSGDKTGEEKESKVQKPSTTLLKGQPSSDSREKTVRDGGDGREPGNDTFEKDGSKDIRDAAVSVEPGSRINGDPADVASSSMVAQASDLTISGETTSGKTTSGKTTSGKTTTDRLAMSSADNVVKGVGKGQLNRELSRKEPVRDRSGTELNRTEGRSGKVHEIEVHLDQKEENSGDDHLLDQGKDNESSKLLARLETPTPQTAAHTSRQIGTHQAAGTLAGRLNGDLGTTIVRQARIMLSESDKAEIRLIIRPPELGRVRINLQMENGHIAGRILVDNGSVREVMEQNLPALQRAFADAGLNVGSFEVFTGDPRHETGADEKGRAGNGGGRRTGRSADAFIENVETIELNDYGHRRVNLVA